jgi:cytochrome P450
VTFMPLPFLGELVSSAVGAEEPSEASHRNFRAMLQPAFTPEAINGQLLPEVVSIVDGALRAWAAKGEAVPGYDAFKRMTFEIIIKVGAGGAVQKMGGCG